MKIRSKSQFIDILDEEISWRKKELTFLKNNVKKNTPNYKTHLRSAIVLLYSHWEGFVKSSCEYFLVYVSGQKLMFSNLNNNLLALSLKYKLIEFESTNKSTIHCKFIEFINNDLEQRATIPTENIIKTNSNLNSHILKEILTNVGIDYSYFELKENLIDKILLKNRNSIAHGETLDIDDLNYQNLHREILTMMEQIKTELSNIVIQENFKK
jgi:hypothetical protein